MKKIIKLGIPVFTIITFVTVFLIYTGSYYRADPSAVSALLSDQMVTVAQTEYGWFFDGPSENKALVFYPGAKVEETAYAPLLHFLAEQAMDVCLVKMPFHLALFGSNKADDVMALYDYDSWYIGGHSLGGAMAANYAAKKGTPLNGVILLAAYPTKALDSGLLLISIYGSEDGILNMDQLSQGIQFAPDNYKNYVIEGGNHAGFGNYGEQAGDGSAYISAKEQQSQTVGEQAAIKRKEERKEYMEKLQESDKSDIQKTDSAEISEEGKEILKNNAQEDGAFVMVENTDKKMYTSEGKPISLEAGVVSVDAKVGE